ncbi:right-handed parallel beta-helix repeat-containing protein [Streptomyces qinzhouensis]|uniref:right-handed parallel beta-helix repeat-containing protein n=1 Tax=Streptomyces qinzhouensis TaxID=2599401 RepID=UPI001645CCE0|nr:right-handed parallel beta-helix repeat-containing protein [Streptomyces qinzhouensis]
MQIAAQIGVFNVRDYGATGNGTTIDTAAMQSAFDAARQAGGGTVLIPAGTYAVDTFLVVYGKTSISAYGATIRSVSTGTGLLRNFATGDNFPVYAGNSGITVEGGIWDGNAAHAGVGTVTGTTNVMSFIHARDITVRDVVIRNISSSHGIEFNAVDGGRILNSRFEGFKDNSAAQDRGFSESVQLDIARLNSSSIGEFDLTTCRNILIQGCYFGPSDRLGAAGRAIGSHTSDDNRSYDNIQIIGCRIEGAAQEGIRAFCWRNCVIADNIITGTGQTAILLAVSAPDQPTKSHSIVVKGNVITDCKTSGIRVMGNTGNRITGVVVSGNTLHNTSGNGIHIADAPGANVSGNHIDTTSSTGIYAVDSDGVTVNGNTILTPGSNGINIAGCTGAMVSGNTVRDTKSNHGIYVGDGTQRSAEVVVSGNTVRMPFTAGIRIAGTAKGCTVSGNRVKGAGPTQYGITLAATVTGTAIVGNDLSGSTWPAGNAIVPSTEPPRVDWSGGTTLPGHNLV